MIFFWTLLTICDIFSEIPNVFSFTKNFSIIYYPIFISKQSKMNNIKAHISISYLEKFPDIGLEEVIADLQEKGLVINIDKRPMEMYASLEWAIPTAVFCYVAKSYFDGFLKEMGKDHHNILKNSIKKITDKARKITVRIVTASESTEKYNKSYSQSNAISLILRTKNNGTIKLLFDNNLSKEDWENAIDQIFDYVIQNYETAKNDKLTEKIQGLKEASGIYVIIDPETKQLIFHDSVSLHHSEKKKN
jgi:hypothetical protein